MGKAKRKQRNKRTPIGTLRNFHKPMPAEALEKGAVADWLAVHVVRLRCFAMTYAQISELLSRAIAGEKVAGIDPIGVGRWVRIKPRPGYDIPIQTLHNAWKRATEDEPAASIKEARDYRRAQLDRVILQMQPKISDPRAARVVIDAVDKAARLDGLVREHVAVENPDGSALTLTTLREMAKRGRAIKEREAAEGNDS